MPQIPVAEYGLPQRATRRAVTASEGDIASLTAPTRALGQIGASAASVGARIADQALEANAQREYANFKGLVNQRYGELQDLAENDPDFEKYGPAWSQAKKDFDSALSGMSRRGKQAANNFWVQANPLYENNVNDLIVQGMDNKAMLEGERQIQNILAAKHYGPEQELQSAARTAAAGKLTVVSQSEAKLADINEALANPVWQKPANQARAIVLRKGALAGIEKAESLARVDAIYEQLSVLDYPDAIAELNKMKFLEESERNAAEARLANLKVVAEKAIETERLKIDNISVLPQDEFMANYEDAQNYINTSNLPVKEKEEARKKLNARIEAISSGKEDPIHLSSANGYNTLAVQIVKNPQLVKESMIRGAVGHPDEERRISLQQGDQLIDLWKKHLGSDVIGKELHREYSAALATMIRERAFHTDKKQNAILGADARALLDAWAIKNPDAQASDYQDFFDRLTDTAERPWYWAWSPFTREKAENRILTRENLAEMQEEIVGVGTYKKGDKRTVRGVTYTYDGKGWRD
jgi:hypothetical protein